MLVRYYEATLGRRRKEGRKEADVIDDSICFHPPCSKFKSTSTYPSWRDRTRDEEKVRRNIQYVYAAFLSRIFEISCSAK